MSGAVKGETAAIAKGRLECSVTRVREVIGHYTLKELRELLSLSSMLAHAANERIRSYYER